MTDPGRHEARPPAPPPELDGQLPLFRPGHRPRDEPYPDELDQQFCEPCGTLCYDGRPCSCCWAEAAERADTRPDAPDAPA